MAKSRKPSAARKPPAPSDSHADIENWIRRVMPDLCPIVKRLDELICEMIPGTAADRLYRRNSWNAADVIPGYASGPYGTLCDTVIFYKELNRARP